MVIVFCLIAFVLFRTMLMLYKRKYHKSVQAPTAVGALQHFAPVQPTVELTKNVSDAPVSLDTSVHPQPLVLLVLAKAHFDTLVWLQLCNPQGDALFFFIRLPQRLPRPFAGAAVYDMSLTHAERLCAVGCGLKGRLVQLFLRGVGFYNIPQSDWKASSFMMQITARHVASKRMAAVRDKAAKEAEELCALGQFVAAQVPLQLAIDLKHLPSRALKAWLHISGREGVAKNWKTAFELAEEGARLGCHLCQGVLAYCHLIGCGCTRDEAQSLELARESSGRGSRYGQLTLGALHLARDDAQAVAFLRLAAAQGLDEAQNGLGGMHFHGHGVAQDFAEALRWWQLAAAQGHPTALYRVAHCYELGHGVRKNKAAAIRWYMRAKAAGNTYAAAQLRRLGA